MNKILFLDRDGVINKDPHGYFCEYKDIEYNEDLILFVKENFEDYIKIIVTNQSGIARGKFAPEKFYDLMENIIKDMKNMGVNIDKYYFSPHLPASNHWDRKPNPGMLEKGLKEYKVNPKHCVMIGDADTDFLAAKNARLSRFIYYNEGKIREIEL